MKYSELINFEPIESVKELRAANAIDQARLDVDSFVISDRMLGLIRDVIAPNLQLDKPADAKGLLIVANYGTGKTHLMSTVSAVAEHSELLGLLRRTEAADALKSVAGRYMVIRSEIGATEMSLRDIVCGDLESSLKRVGVEFKFPSIDEVPRTKDSLEEMMSIFDKAYPKMGLLFVLDELLDYLRGRRDAQLNLDLRFLREVGEVCRSTRFRIMCGMQEAIFDNPRFANVASDVQRVKARFEQARISREDVAYVVRERLLGKTVAQRDRIREHMQRFTSLYEGMAERLEDFVGLFPVHPAYLRVFEQITVEAVEKREVLKTLSAEMKQLWDRDVPEDAPGLICYDSYRARLADDPSVRQWDEVRQVLEKTDVLRGRIEQAMANRHYIPVAKRIVDGLAVHRLTTYDLDAPIGPTPKELRDDLCLLPANLPERDALFLEITVRSVIDEMMRAVSGQFITENPENGQIYLDLKKDIDYDQRIQVRGISLDEEELDRAYFMALEEVLERRDKPYVSGFNIWEYELPWLDRRVTRIGYLFLGAPNERSTAQPPRDYYIYFIQPFTPPKFTDEEKADEVFFRLERPDDAFSDDLRKYAAARALSTETTESHRAIYESKAAAARARLSAWLREHMGEAVTVTYRGDRQPLKSRLAGAPGTRSSVKEQVDAVSAALLKGDFEARYPGYPKFEAEITKANLAENVRQALGQIAGSRRTELSAKLLRSLQLLAVDESIAPSGPYATALLDTLKAARGQVVNRDQLLVERDRDVESWPPWHLEPAWLIVVAAAMTQIGRAEIGYPGGRVDAMALEQLPRMNLEELLGFTHIAPPKELPLVALRAIAQLLGLPAGAVSDQGVSGDVVTAMLAGANALLKRVSEARSAVHNRPTIWGAVIIELPEERDARLAELQTVLEDVRARTSVGRMNKFSASIESIDGARAGLRQLVWIEAAVAAQSHLSSTVDYLREAVDDFGEEQDLSKEAMGLRDGILTMLRSDAAPDPKRVSELRIQGEDLRRRFADEAARSHRRNRLDGAGDEHKRRIIEGEELKDLSHLATISILPSSSLEGLKERLLRIQSCKMFDESDLMKSVRCPECGYRPSSSDGPTASRAVEQIETRLRALADEWTRTLRENLSTPEMLEQVALLAPKDRALVQAFASDGKLPHPLPNALVTAMDKVFKRFEVRKVSRDEIWHGLFPEDTPATIGELRDRFETFVTNLSADASPDRLRIVPSHDAES